MDDALLDQELASANPWWREPDWERRDVQLRRLAATPYDYRPDALGDLVRGGLYLLRGPRRVGKSTEVKRTVADLLRGGADPRTVVYASVEGWSADDLAQLVRRAARMVSGQPGQRHWFIDEVTAVAGSWPATVQRLRDQNVDFAEDTVVLTGSSSAMLDEATRHLAGRRGDATRTDRLLLQMPFVEVAKALGVRLPDLVPLDVHELARPEAGERFEALRPWLPDLVSAWATYLRIGGYPQAVSGHVTGDGAGEALLETLWQLVHGDALRAVDSPATQTLSVLRSVTQSLTSRLEVAHLARDAAIAHATARGRLEALRRSLIAFPVHREQGRAPKPRSSAKWYFTDPLLARLAATRGLGVEPDATRLTEQQVAVALLRTLERSHPTAALRHDQLLYHRSGTGAEIDFVAAPFGDVCVESKHVDRGAGRALQTVQASDWTVGVVATRTAFARHEHGWSVPAGMLAVALGA